MHVNPPARTLGRVNAIITTTAVPYLVERFPGPLVVPQLRRMHAGFRRGHVADDWLEDQFHVLAERVVLSREAYRREVAGVPALRPATREELHRRLCRARDHMHGSVDRPLTLATISREACLAPHHFHRVFRQVFGRTPHEYMTGLRIARARTLLAVTDQPVSEI